MVGTPTQEWTRVSSISRNTTVWYYCDDWYRTGKLEQDATLFINDSENITGREEWALAQRGWMLPGQDNDFDNEWGSSNNYRTKITQNWQRSDLTPIDHKDHAPVKDKKSSFDTELEVSSGGAAVQVDYNIPYIKRDVQYDSGKKVKTVYTYPYRLCCDEARDVDCNHEQLSIWTTDDPSDGDNVAPSYYFGEFRHGGCSSDVDLSSDDLFGWLEYQA